MEIEVLSPSDMKTYLKGIVLKTTELIMSIVYMAIIDYMEITYLLVSGHG